MTANHLFLVPAPLSQETPRVDLTTADLATVRSIKHWLVETPKAARAILKFYGHPVAISELDIRSLLDFKNKAEITDFFKKLASDSSVGVLSDAGCPGIADPGALAVAAAHELEMTVKPMVGASALLLALMGSGMSGQSFTFHGYLPVDEQPRTEFIKRSESQSGELSQTQMAIETPYRNQVLFNTLIKTLKPSTLLCIATEITGTGESIRTQPIEAWRRNPVEIGKRATLFLWQAQTTCGRKSNSTKKR
jgi:16S rRNA (cytidine1402-2'-O)-methyltransferase